MKEIERVHNRGDLWAESREVFSYHLHSHSYYEMILYEAFDGAVSVNTRNIEIDGITAILICPSDLQEISVRDPRGAKYVKIGFDADILIDKSPESSMVLRGISEEDTVLTVFRLAFAERGDKTLLKLLINCAVHILTERGESVLPVSDSKGYGFAVSAARMINEDFSGDITLSSAAKRLSVAPQYLSSVFGKNMGMTFSEYLCNLRLGYAARLIEDSKKSITEICFESGWGNFSHFSRSFKRRYGVSPREYRQIRKNI